MDVDALIAKAGEHVSGGRAWGPVIERDGCTVIPAAYVLSAGGGGGGSGPSPDGHDGDHAGHDGDHGSGGGIGHFSLTWPIGAYVVKYGSAKWVPAIDATRVAIAVVVAAKVALKLRGARRLLGGS